MYRGGFWERRKTEAESSESVTLHQQRDGGGDDSATVSGRTRGIDRRGERERERGYERMTERKRTREKAREIEREWEDSRRTRDSEEWGEWKGATGRREGDGREGSTYLRLPETRPPPPPPPLPADNNQYPRRVSRQMCVVSKSSPSPCLYTYTRTRGTYV